MDNKGDIRQLTLDQIETILKDKGLPKYRTKQINEWLWQKGARTFDEMTSLPLDLREWLDDHFVINAIRTDKIQRSNDGTIKSRFVLHDGYKIESVLIPVPFDDRYTVCVSSQVGCSLSCSFCATGQMKRERNLYAAEIVDQVVEVNKQSLEHFDHPLTNIVFMGMGEPLLAYNEVMQSVEHITSPDGLQMSPRRITISTAGIAKMIKRLADDHPKVKLALSLHAADDSKRNEIMPINETNNLAALMEAMEYFFSKSKNRISYEYIALSGINDGIDDAMKLVRLCRRFPVMVNIIEYNPVMGATFEKSPEDKIDRFAKYLRDHDVMCTVRRSRGKDIDAACGQLANKG